MDPAPPPVARPTQTVTSSPSEPSHELVVIEARGTDRKRLEVAVEDLKTVGMWRQLTRHLYRVELDARRGTANVPEDGHLADAYFTGTIEGDRGGAVCDVMFFSSAVTVDLVRWRDYYARGLIAEPPPTLRQFYGSLLAHELAHCLPGGGAARSEEVAQAWERRARDALRASI